MNGGQSELQFQIFARQYQHTLQETGFTAEILKSEVVNIINTCNFSYKLNLDLIAETFKLLCEPELFPTVRLRFVIYEVTVNIFRTSKCNILGERTVDKVQDCLKLVIRNLDSRFFLGVYCTAIAALSLIDRTH